MFTCDVSGQVKLSNASCIYRDFAGGERLIPVWLYLSRPLESQCFTLMSFTRASGADRVWLRDSKNQKTENTNPITTYPKKSKQRLLFTVYIL